MAARASSSSHGGGFPVDAGVRIEAPDRAGLERLLRYCARPPFAMDRLKQRGADLVYRCGKGHTHDNEPLQSDKYPGELVRERRPGVEVVLYEMRPADHVQALREGRLDLSVTRSAPSDGALQAALLWRDPVVGVVPLGHRLAGRTRIRVANLKGEDFVFLRLDSSTFAQRVFGACVAAGYAPRIVQEVVEIPAVLNLVAAGLGVSLVPGSLARQRQDTVAVCSLGRELQASGVSGDLYLLRRSGEQPPAVHEFAEALHDWASGRSASGSVT